MGSLPLMSSRLKVGGGEVGTDLPAGGYKRAGGHHPWKDGLLGEHEGGEGLSRPGGVGKPPGGGGPHSEQGWAGRGKVGTEQPR